MQKAETPSQPAASGLSSKAKLQGFWPLIVLATVLLLASSWIAWEQEPHSDAFRAAPDWISSDFWQYPVEVNAFKRLPSIRENLFAIHVHADGQRIWTAGKAGSRGIICKS